MKNFNIAFSLILLAFVGFSFISYNNFTAEKNSEIGTDKTNFAALLPAPNLLSNDTLAREKLIAYIDEKLVLPIRACAEEGDPHAFMTKCYTDIYFEIDNERHPGPIYVDYDVRGGIYIRNCSSAPDLMAYVKVNYKNKTISVKESFAGQVLDKDAYLNSICKVLKKNGLSTFKF